MAFLEKTVNPINRVNCLINNLTQDEDMRQELWLHYLSGHSVDSFTAHLKKIKEEYSEDEKLKQAVWSLIQNPLPDNLSSILESFSEYEKSIICFLMLGLDVAQISAMKGISEVRIRQTISSIGYNECWSKYGTQETLK